MNFAKCPICGERLVKHPRRCPHCSAELVVCSECGSVSKKGTQICDMCGKALVRQRVKTKRSKKDSIEGSMPNDLVSVINYVKKKNIAYRLIKCLKVVSVILFLLSLALSAIIGLLTSGGITDPVITMIQGGNFSDILDMLLDTVPRNIELWKDFFGGLIGGNISADDFFSIYNYIISALSLVLLIAVLYYPIIFLPLDIIEMIVCGIAAKRLGYNGADTVTVFECPSLVYNSSDSFDKAYTYFAFMQHTSGKMWAVSADIAFYFSKLFCCLAAFLMIPIYGVMKILVVCLFGGLLGSAGTGFLLVVLSMIIGVGFIIAVLLVSILSDILVSTLRSKQLKKWKELV